MAVVLLARDLRHDRLVAIKVLHHELAAVLGSDRFLREIRTAGRLDHPAILPVLDSGESEGRLWFAMPYVDGGSLRQRLQREVQLDIEESVRIAREVGSAMEHAHRHGIVHRDIKPENILLSGGRVLLADFGIAKLLDAGDAAKLTETGLALGTPAYMSPEQAAGDTHLDGRTDIYALACVLYEMLAGQPPFTGPTTQSIMARHALEALPPLRTIRTTVPAALEATIVKAAAKVPADRFATAAAFARALSAAEATAITPVTSPVAILSRRRVWALAAGILLATGTGAAAWTLLRDRGPAVLPSASVLAVLPFAPATGDSALVRLGRDLASTVSASLDGVGDIRTVDRLTVLAQTPTSGASLPLRDAAALARRFGATSVVSGSLARDGARVRLDVGLYTTDDLTPLARRSVLAAPESLSALTDSVVWKLLADIWRRGTPPTPTLEALTTHSVDALRAYLDGEREAVAGNLAEAHAHYGRAIAADSSFWFAYFRLGNVAGWAESGVDSATEAAYWTHRHLLPQRERMLIEAARGDSGMFRQREQLETIVERYPDYWPGWWMLGDPLWHTYGHIGATAADAGKALERVVQLNPGMVAAWEHLVWLASSQRDTATMARGLDALDRLGAGPTFRRNQGMDKLLGWRAALAVLRRSPSAPIMLDSVYRDAVLHSEGIFVRGVWLQGVGEPADQIDFNRRLLRNGLPPEEARTLTYLSALAWASRGAWDSALALREQLVRSPGDTIELLNVYRTAVLAASVGALPASQAALHRRPVARLTQGMGPPLRADLAWLDGVLAAGKGDTAGLVSARAAVRQTAALWAPFLDRSLGAFETALRGDQRTAAAQMTALEWELADGSPWFAFGPRTPHVLMRGIDRMAAAGWLLAEGDSAQAIRILGWHRSFPPLDDKIPLAPLAYLIQAGVEDAQGDTAAARGHYQQFLARYDRPVPAHRHLVAQARAALARLGAAPPGPPPER
jgi:TolB-like protein/tetratricopeptide (TPR) repeat protein